MSLFVIADLHLSFGVKKPMDIFGGWENYTELLRDNWINLVNNDDTVVIPGDFSWAMKIEEALPDFKFVDALPGKKILIKGNHDFWWTTLKKNTDFVKANGIFSISFLQNNHFVYEDTAVCGARGWFFEDADNFSERVAAREVTRLDLSLSSAQNGGAENKLAFLHFPPIYKNRICNEIVNTLRRYNVKRCFYGHLHGHATAGAFNGELDGTEYRLVSADYLKFVPLKVL